MNLRITQSLNSHGTVCVVSIFDANYVAQAVLCCMTNLFCNVLVKFGKGAVEAEQGAIHELAWKKSQATQQWERKSLMSTVCRLALWQAETRFLKEPVLGDASEQLNRGTDHGNLPRAMFRPTNSRMIIWRSSTRTTMCSRNSSTARSIPIGGDSFRTFSRESTSKPPIMEVVCLVPCSLLKTKSLVLTNQPHTCRLNW